VALLGFVGTMSGLYFSGKYLMESTIELIHTFSRVASDSRTHWTWNDGMD
jgi:hypothetical protein